MISTIIQLFGCVLIFLSTIFIIILYPRSRRKLRHVSAYEEHLHFLVLLRQIFLFIFPTAILMALSMLVTVKLEYVLGTIVLGLSILIFVSVQLPLLMKAHLVTSFRIDDGKWTRGVNLRPGKVHKVEGLIQNLGFSTYKNFSVIFYFGKEFEILPSSHSKYKSAHLDFRKKFSIQQEYGGVMFSPNENFLTIPPKETFVFPMFIKAPNEEKEYTLHIQFSAENTWGMTRIYKRVIVREYSP